MKRLLFIGIVILLGSVLSGCGCTDHSQPNHYKRERIVRVIEYRRYQAKNHLQYHHRPSHLWHR